LPDRFWDEVGWSDRATLGDGRHLYIYAARTPDGRIAIGGRGAPYHFGSTVNRRFEEMPEVFEKLRGVLRCFFPALGDVPVTHRWGGPLAIPRDWQPSVGVDATTGIGWAGGYVGDGVATSNLFGRILADLLTGRQSELVRLPLVGHRSPLWEPEPLRWLGVGTSMKLLARADRTEARSGRPSVTAKAVKRVLGV
jgi:glycine/D-amino acid oxidase-like deaminating enzyme